MDVFDSRIFLILPEHISNAHHVWNCALFLSQMSQHCSTSTSLSLCGSKPVNGSIDDEHVSLDAKGRTNKASEQAKELSMRKNLFSFENILNEHLLSLRKTRKRNQKSNAKEEKASNKNSNENNEQNGVLTFSSRSHSVDANATLGVDLRKENKNLLLLNENLMQIVKIKHRNKASLFNLCLPNKINEDKRVEKKKKCNEIANVYMDQMTSLSMPWAKKKINKENEAQTKEIDQVERNGEENANGYVQEVKSIESNQLRTGKDETESETVTLNETLTKTQVDAGNDNDDDDDDDDDDQEVDDEEEEEEGEEPGEANEEESEKDTDDFKLENNACKR